MTEQTPLWHLAPAEPGERAWFPELDTVSIGGLYLLIGGWRAPIQGVDRIVEEVTVERVRQIVCLTQERVIWSYSADADETLAWIRAIDTRETRVRIRGRDHGLVLDHPRGPGPQLLAAPAGPVPQRPLYLTSRLFREMAGTAKQVVSGPCLIEGIDLCGAPVLHGQRFADGLRIVLPSSRTMVLAAVLPSLDYPW